MRKDKLSNQRRAVQKSLPEDERIEIERDARSHADTENNPEESTDPSADLTNIEPRDDNDDDEEVDENPPNSEPKTDVDKETQDMIDKFYEEVLVIYRRYLTIPITEREKPKKFSLTKENRKKLEAMNEALKLILNLEEEMTLTDLNTLHYAGAVSIAGTIIPGSDEIKPPFDPDAKIKKKIESIRKTIGKLTAIQKGGKISKKMKKLIGIKDTESALRTHHMRLAALCKKLRSKNASRNRFRNNKMFRNKQKEFYNKLKYGETNKIVDPPSAQNVKDFWGNLYAEKAVHNKDAPWIEAERNMMTDKPQLNG